MICKFCQAEIGADATVCPVCGKDLTETQSVREKTAAEQETAEATPKVKEKKTKGNGQSVKLVLSVLGLVLLAEVLSIAVLHYTGVIQINKDISVKEISVKWKYGKSATAGTTVATDNTEPTKPLVSYTADNATVDAAGNTVVAKLGDQTLTNSELQIYYWTAVSDFIQYYGGYVEYIGLDINAPLDEQIYDTATGKTYQQWFLENAIESWRRYATVVQMAEDAGFQMTQEQQEQIDNIPETIREEAQTEGFTDVEAYVDEYFPGSSLEGYIRYNVTTWTAICYYNELFETLLPTQEEIEAYYTANEGQFVENGMSKEDGLYYDVRHILIPIEGEIGEVNGVPAYSDEQWEQCKEKAQKALDDFLAGNGDESAFAQLAEELSADPGFADNGGLYEQLTKDTGFIEPFTSWYIDESRKPGDTGLVKNTESSTQGYHIMYFCDSYPIWEYEAKTAILDERTDVLLQEAQTKWPLTTDYDHILLGQVELAE